MKKLMQRTIRISLMKQCLLLMMLVTLCHQQQQVMDNSSLKQDNVTSDTKTSGQAFQKSTIFQLFANNKCNTPPTPKKFAIATVTRFRATGENDLKQGIQFFKQYLKQYAQMQCDLFDSIYLIWNNEKSPQQYPTLLEHKNKWKKNVYFIQTKFNSMDHRFAFPSWVEQEVFMSLDDDAVIDCDNMKKTFNQWQSHVIGGLGPFGAVQMSGRTMEYHMSEDKFEYKYGTKSYISMALPNIGMAPRHFYDLYYSNLPQFQRMRNLVTQYSNCDDIGLNFMIGYIYPQIRPIAFKGIDARTKSFTIEINKTPTHGQKRNDCINKFTQILGENTFSYSLINKNQEYEKDKQDPLRKNHCILALKRSIMQMKYLNYDHYYNNMKKIYVHNSTQLSIQLMELINSDNYILSLDKQARDSLVSENKINIKYRQRHSVEDVFGVQAIENHQNKQTSQYINAKQENQMLTTDLTMLRQQFQVLKIILIVSNVILVLLVMGILLRFCINFYSSKKQKKKGQMIQESYSTQLQSGRVSSDK